MTRWGFLLPDILDVAIYAAIGLLVMLKLFFDGRDLRISRLLIVLVTSSARSDRDVGRQSTQSACARNVDMAGRALHNVFAFATFMTEHLGRAFRCEHRHERSGRLVATGAVVAGRLLTLPMTVEAGVMSVRDGLEKSVECGVSLSWAHQRHHVPAAIRLVTD